MGCSIVTGDDDDDDDGDGDGDGDDDDDDDDDDGKDNRDEGSSMILLFVRFCLITYWNSQDSHCQPAR